MKKFFIILLLFFFGISSYAQEEEFDDVYYIPSKNIQNESANEINFNNLSLVKRNQLIRNAYFDFHWNNHNYYGSYMWKLKYNYRIGYMSYWDYQLYYDLIYWDSWYYNDFYYNKYYSYNWNYYDPHIYNSKPPVRQRTITQRPERKVTSTYVKPHSEPKSVNQSGRVDHRVYSKVLPRERYDRPESVRTTTKPVTRTYQINNRSSSYSGQRNTSNRSESTVRGGSSTSSTNRNSSSGNNSKRR